MVIGVKEDCLVGEPEHSTTLIAGDRLLFYTDGIIETRNAQGRQLGQSRLSQIAASALTDDPFDMADHIIRDIEAFRNGPPTDDMTVIVVEMR